MQWGRALGLGLGLAAAMPLQAMEPERVELSGNVAVEERIFTQDSLYVEDAADNTTSVTLQPELYLGWQDDSHSFNLVGFVRAGDADDERNHADIREALWLSSMGDWEVRAGIGKVFWGVTESRHLVDVINQTDYVENPDGEDKLGQPMVNLNFFTDYGTVEFYALPIFRERTFAGEDGRPRGPLVVDTDQDAIYESDDEDHHLDVALRWFNYIGDWDVSLSHFSGTNRNPQFDLGVNGNGETVLVPHYYLMDRTGLTVQAIIEDWLWKLEATSTRSDGDRYAEAVAGFEYTRVGIFETTMDLGMIAEYLYDERGDKAPQPFNNDLMVGLRWVFNDMQSSEILMGTIFDMEGSADSFSVEASRRLGQSWKLSGEYRGYMDADKQDPVYPFRNDDYLQVDLAYYF